LLALKSKYTAERSYSVPIECMKALIVDLQRLGSDPNAAAPALIVPRTRKPARSRQHPGQARQLPRRQ